MSSSKPSLAVSEAFILAIAAGVQTLASISASRCPIPARNPSSSIIAPSPSGASSAQRRAASTDRDRKRHVNCARAYILELLVCSPRWCSVSSGPCRVDQPLLTSPMRYRSDSRMSL